MSLLGGASLDEKVNLEAVHAALARAKARVQYTVTDSHTDDVSYWLELLKELEKLEETIPQMNKLCQQDEFARMHLVDQSYKHFNEVLDCALRLGRNKSRNGSYRRVVDLTERSKRIRLDKSLLFIREDLMSSQEGMDFELAINQLRGLQNRVSEDRPQKLYKPLDQSRFEIRILELVDYKLHNEPSTAPAMFCQLRTESLVTCNDYHALSYCWGDQLEGVSVVIDGQTLTSTSNLAMALKEMHRRGVHRVWADALCINQCDTGERSSQILVMGQIYRQAKGVIVWPDGASKYDDPSWGAAMESLASSTGKQDSVADRRWHLSCIMNNAYWSRSWIVQEVAKAKCVELWYRDRTLPFERLSQYLNYGRCSSSCAISCDLHLEPRCWDLLNSLCSFRAQEQRQSLRTVRIQLSTALLANRHRTATDERDVIYALLGLTRDGADLLPIPNYMQSVADIFTKTTRSMILRQGQEVLIMLAGARRRRHTWSLDECKLRDANLPSWVPDWSKLPCNLPPWILRMVESPLSAIPEKGSVDIDPDVGDLDPAQSIHLSGHILDDLACVGGKSDRSINLRAEKAEWREWSKRAERSADAIVDVSDRYTLDAPLLVQVLLVLSRLYRIVTETADLTEDERVYQQSLTTDEIVSIITCQLTGRHDTAADSMLRRFWLHTTGFVRVGRHTIHQYARLWEQSTVVSYQSDGQCDVILQRAFANLENYRMKLVVSSQDNLSVVYEDAQVGDSICLLENCALPVILRRVSNGRYQYIGEVCSTTIDASPTVLAEASQLFCIV
ncbi:hypothetical protein LTR86_002447 [Recurvomyces mirabilis]|nr:hypothetical protein LTR86_002447 [Recurvomyces mirabilis]